MSGLLKTSGERSDGILGNVGEPYVGGTESLAPAAWFRGHLFGDAVRPSLVAFLLRLQGGV